LTISGAGSDLAGLLAAAEAEFFVEADVLSTASGIFCVSSAAGGTVVCTFDEVVAGVVDAGFGAELTGLGAGSAATVVDCAGTEEVAGTLAVWLDRPCK